MLNTVARDYSIIPARVYLVSLTFALLMVQCRALFSWSYNRLKSRVPRVAVKTEE